MHQDKFNNDIDAFITKLKANFKRKNMTIQEIPGLLPEGEKETNIKTLKHVYQHIMNHPKQYFKSPFLRAKSSTSLLTAYLEILKNTILSFFRKTKTV